MKLCGIWNFGLNDIENKEDHFFEMLYTSEPFSDSF